MKQWVYRHRTVTGQHGALAARLKTELPRLLAAAVDQPDAAPAGDGSFLLRVGSEIAGAPVNTFVRVRTGVAVASEGAVSIPVSWAPEPLAHGFPSFEGQVVLESKGPTLQQLALVGAHVLPSGPLATLNDASVLRVAEGTVGQILDGLARALTSGADELVISLDPAVITVRDVMTPDPLVLDEDLPLRTAALLLLSHEITGAPVRNADGALIGVLSEEDLLEKEAAPRVGVGAAAGRSRRLRSARTVGEACTRPALVTAADSALQDAAREMLDRGVSRLVVLENSRIAGIVTRHDVLKALIRDDERIAAAARQVLASLDEHEVTVEVEWGRVTVGGRLSRLSRLQTLKERMARIDGVMELDFDPLVAVEDDVFPATHGF